MVVFLYRWKDGREDPSAAGGPVREPADAAEFSPLCGESTSPRSLRVFPRGQVITKSPSLKSNTPALANTRVCNIL